MNEDGLDVVLCGDVGIDVLTGLNEAVLPGSESYAESLDFTLGGSAAIGHIAISHLGLRTKVVSMIGDDAEGHLTHTLLREHGMDLHETGHARALHTHVAIVLARGTERTIIGRPPSPVCRLPTSIPCAKVWLVSGYWLFRYDNHHLLGLARAGARVGARIILDVSPMHNVTLIEPWLARRALDSLICHPDLANRLVGGGLHDRFKSSTWAEKHALNLLVHDNASPTILATPRGLFSETPGDIDAAWTTVGAGDALAAGFAAARSLDRNDQPLVSMANQVAALYLTRRNQTATRRPTKKRGNFHA